MDASKTCAWYQSPDMLILIDILSYTLLDITLDVWYTKKSK